MNYKFIIPIFLSIVVGLFFGKIFFDSYDNTSITVFDEKDKIYMLELGIYSSKDKMKKSYQNYQKYLYLQKEDGYHLYIGITKEKEIASKVKELYEKDGYSIYVKETIIDNKSFLSVLGEYDKIINISSEKDIPEIEKIVISNYKEMVLENEN